MNTYKWTLNHVNAEPHYKPLDSGIIEDVAEAQAKRIATKSSGSKGWKKSWRKDQYGTFFKYEADARSYGDSHRLTKVVTLSIVKQRR